MAKKTAPAMGTSKNQAAADRVRTAAIGAGEPKIDIDNYDSNLGAALTYYNTYEDDKNKRKWVVKYLDNRKDDISKLSDVPDWAIRQIAVLIRLKSRNQYLKPQHEALIESKLFTVLNKPIKVKEDDDVPVVAKVTIQDRINKIASNYIAEIENELDVFTINKKSDFSMKDYIASNAINAPTAKIISAWFSKTLAELSEAVEGEDEQLVEGYSQFTTSGLKKFRNFVNSIIDDCKQQAVRVVRKPRKVKAKPVSEVVKRIKYLPEFKDDDISIKSEPSYKLVNSNEVWLYNTKSRRMTVLKAVDKDILVVKGGSIVNFDTSKSETRTLRKPEEFLKTDLNKRALATAWKMLTTKASTAKGRVSDDTVIIAVFS